MTKKKPSTVALEDWIVNQIAENPGITAKGLAARYRTADDKVLGPYIEVSRTIANLRRAGLIEDVEHRCPYCNSALTRGQRNVPLYLTPKGVKHAYELIREAA